LYLTRYKFQTVEAHQLRLAFEEVTGKDLNWFFNQWFFGKGHPQVTINHYYDDSAKKVIVRIRQTQNPDNIFRIPITIDIYTNSKKASHRVWINSADETFAFECNSRPDLIDADAEKVVLWKKTENKTLENFIYQYEQVGNYIDRREAIEECLRQQQNPLAMDLLKTALKDKYPGLRDFTLRELGRRWERKSDSIKQIIEPILVDLAKNDKKSTVKAKAIGLLALYQKKEYRDLFMANLNDSSYSVAAAALIGLSSIDSVAAFEQAKIQMKLKAKGSLTIAVITTIMKYGSQEQFDLISSQYDALPFTTDKLRMTGDFINYLDRIQSTEIFKKAIDIITSFLNLWDERFKLAFNEDLIKLAAKKESEGLSEQSEYIKSKLPKQ
jgi:aminopeptidase N